MDFSNDKIINYFSNKSNLTYENISIPNIKDDLIKLLGTNIDISVEYKKDIKVFEGINGKPIVNDVKKIENILVVYTDYMGNIKSTKIKLDA